MATKRLDTAALRRHSAATVLRAMRTRGPATSTKLASVTGMARSTVDESLVLLGELELVETLAPLTDGRMGRPPRLHRFRAESGLVVGIAIYATKTIAVALDLCGTVLTQVSLPVQGTLDDTSPIELVLTAAAEVADAAGSDLSGLRGLGVGCPGHVNPDGVVVANSLAPSWRGTALAAELSRDRGCPVLVDNGGRMALAGETGRGVAQGHSNVLQVLGAGLGFGVGAMVNGEILTGEFGAAGEIGHAPMIKGLRQDRAAQLSALLPELPPDRALVVALGSSAAEFRDFRDRYVSDAAVLIATMVLALDPAVVVLGGDFITAQPSVISEITETTKSITHSPAPLVLSTLRDDAVALGSADRALQVAEEGMYGYAELLM